MRLVYTTEDAIRARKFAAYLVSQGIENRLEMTTNDDWGNADYGVPKCNVWIYDEDQLEKAMKYAEEFKEDPENSSFQTHGIKTEVQPQVLPSSGDSEVGNRVNFGSGNNDKTRGRGPAIEKHLSNNITLGLIVLCCILFLVCDTTSPSLKSLPTNLPYTPLTASQTEKEFLYDYPRTYELVDKAVKLYGVEKLQTPQDLPSAGQFLLKEIDKTPYWHGFYDIALNELRGEPAPAKYPPMFEKIREGQVWRLFTPALLHGSIFHIGFNMLWLIVLGKQIEQRLSGRRYLLLILLLGIFSNTCQYLMGGPNFLGFSGIIVGMLTFIWARQKVAPWEGYPLQKATIHFLMYFILAMLMLQIFSFILEVRRTTPFTPGIANTAHFAGAFLGALLGRLSFFSWKTSKFTRSPK